MGLDLRHILSDERHYGDFVCAICQQVSDLDALVTVPCSHCYCRPCLEAWIGRRTTDGVPKCPTCSQDLLYSHNTSSNTTMMMIGPQSVTVQPLQHCQPLAYRILKKIEVGCPFRGTVGCRWSGDYGDLRAHLLSSTAHENRNDLNDSTTTTASDASDDDDKEANHSRSARQEERQLALARSYKAEGNERFAAGRAQEASELYGKALAALSNENNDDLRSTLYANRAACLLQLERYGECVQDCNRALELDPSYLKAYTRKAKALTSLGRFERAVETWRVAQKQSENQKVVDKELAKAESLWKLVQEGRAALAEDSFGNAKAAFGKALRDCSSPDVVLGVARADLGLGLTESAMRFTLQVVRGSGSMVAEGYEVRGHCLFLMGDFEGSKKLVAEALRQAPDLASAQKLRKRCHRVVKLVQEARDCSFHRRFQEAAQLYTGAIDEVPILPPKSALFGILHSERAEARVRLKHYEAALKDCALVLNAQEGYYKPALLVRLKALHGLGRHQDAKNLADRLVEKWGDTEFRQAQNKADFEVRKLKRVDLYRLLEVSPVASEREIKAAYNSKSRECHPDRTTNLSEEEQKKASRRYRLLGDALEILCDDSKRKLWDQGYDQRAIQERVERAKRAASSM